MAVVGQNEVRVVGRYALYNPIAAGGMATVHLGRLLGPVGFSRTVAIKRLHAQYAADPEFVTMFLDEARLAARIRHPNVVPTLDVVATDGELFLVMDYVPGESVARLSRALLQAKQSIPLRILSGIMVGALHGLHAAHEAKDERGHPLGIVHRDISPQNILVGSDGVARVLDFGVAKAAGRMQTTKDGQVKGKLSYMPPEQLRGEDVTRQTDIYAVGVMLWELVTGKRLFAGDNEGVIVGKILEGKVSPPSHVSLMGGRTMPANRGLLEAFDRMILRALNASPAARYPTAREMALDLERIAPPATTSELADWVETLAHDVLVSRAQIVADIESSTSTLGDGGKHAVMAAIASAPKMRESAPSFVGPPTGYFAVPTSAFVPAVPPVTQPSTISVTASRFPGRVGGRSNTAAIVGVGVLLAGALLGSAFVLRGVLGGRATAAPSSALSSFALPPPVPPPALPTPSVAPPPPEEPAPVVDAGPPTRPVLKKAVAKGAAAAADECATPYWFDANNVKHYKPACLNR